MSLPLLSEPIFRLMFRIEVWARGIRCDRCKHYGPDIGRYSNSVKCARLKRPVWSHQSCRYFEWQPEKPDPRIKEIFDAGMRQGRYNAYWDWRRGRLIAPGYEHIMPRFARLRVYLSLLNLETYTMYAGLDAGYDSELDYIARDKGMGDSDREIDENRMRYFSGVDIINRSAETEFYAREVDGDAPAAV